MKVRQPQRPDRLKKSDEQENTRYRIAFDSGPDTGRSQRNGEGEDLLQPKAKVARCGEHSRGGR